jgi:WD40 repeat protein
LELWGHDFTQPTPVVACRVASGNQGAAGGIQRIGPSHHITLRQLLGSDTSQPQPKANGRIAFASNQTGSYQIFTANSDGSDLRQLTFNAGLNAHPSYSPDGLKVAYTGDTDGNLDVWVIDTDGSNQMRLTSDPSMDIVPCFSPDGRWVASVQCLRRRRARPSTSLGQQ